ncbi:hypothetical protein O181_129647, partial [Austropuccinia psidii MF-1]|nr:hypothetical protein [Austropuccinia psidii MF-1]
MRHTRQKRAMWSPDENCPDVVSKPHLSPIQAIQVPANHNPVSESEKIFTSPTWKGLTALPPHLRMKRRLFTARNAFLILLLYTLH